MRSITVGKNSGITVTNRQDKPFDMYLKDISKISKPIPPDEEVELFAKYKKGDNHAKEKLIRANLRFVVSVAKKYETSGLPMIDLVNEGNIGLIRSLDDYDPTLGNKLITHAVWHIRREIISFIGNQKEVVRIPQNKKNEISKILKYKNKFFQENGRYPLLEELPKELQIKNYHDATIKTTYLDKPLDQTETSASTYGDLILYSNDNNLENIGFSEDVKIALNRLDARYREVLVLSYGIGVQQNTVEEISEKLGLEKFRVQDLLKTAKRIFKKKIVSGHLFD